MNDDIVNAVIASVDECDSNFADHAGFVPLCSYNTKFHSPWMLGGCARKSSNIIVFDFSEEDPFDPEPILASA